LIVSSGVSVDEEQHLAKNPQPTAAGAPKVEDLRKLMVTKAREYNEWTGPAFTGTEISHDIPMRDGFSSTLKVQKPAGGTPGPLCVLIFGGGFVGGTPEAFEKTGRVLVHLFGATVVRSMTRMTA
jgi:hypothetical protein